MRHTLLLAVLCTITGIYGYSQQSLSLEDAAAILYSNNNAIKISETGVEVAKARKQQLNSAWYPFISAAGGYFHFSNKISADANMGNLAQDAVQTLSQTFPELGQILQMLPQLQQAVSSLGNINLSFPLLERNIASIDAVALWPLFTGGKRILAGKIGTSLHQQAQELNTLTTNAQMALMLNAYYTLKLSREVGQMNTENLQFMEKLLYNAQRLKEEGFINKAEYLIIQVARDEASRELQSSTQNIQVASSALSAVLGKEINGKELSGRWFTMDSLPCVNTIYESILQQNAQLKILEQQEGILESNEKIAKSNYLPNIALFAKQNIYSYNVPENLMPRTIFGATMQWNLFDGLNREKEIRKSRLEQEQTIYAYNQAQQDLLTAAIALRSKMEDAACNISTLEQTLQLALELLREREKSYAEGMCTSTDVVAARTSVTKARTALNLAHWEYCTSLANLLTLSSDTYKFIELHNEYGK